jgi:hypothetical protein
VNEGNTEPWDRRNLMESQEPRVNACQQVGKASKGGMNRKITSKQVMGHNKFLVKPQNESRAKIKGPMWR